MPLRGVCCEVSNVVPRAGVVQRAQKGGREKGGGGGHMALPPPASEEPSPEAGVVLCAAVARCLPLKCPGTYRIGGVATLCRRRRTAAAAAASRPGCRGRARRECVALSGGVAATDLAGLGNFTAFAVERGGYGGCDGRRSASVRLGEVVEEHGGEWCRRYLHAGCSLRDGSVVLSGGIVAAGAAGGDSGVRYYTDVCVLAPPRVPEDLWAAGDSGGGNVTSFPGVAARAAHTAVASSTGRVLLFGGWELSTEEAGEKEKPKKAKKKRDNKEEGPAKDAAGVSKRVLLVADTSTERVTNTVLSVEVSGGNGGGGGGGGSVRVDVVAVADGADAPPPRAHHAAVLRSGHGGADEMIVVGGVGGVGGGASGDGGPANAAAAEAAPAGGLLGDAWAFAVGEGVWRRVEFANLTECLGGTGVAGHSAAYDSGLDCILVVGGVRGGGGAPLLCLACVSLVCRAVQMAPSVERTLQPSRVFHSMVLRGRGPEAKPRSTSRGHRSDTPHVGQRRRRADPLRAIAVMNAGDGGGGEGMGGGTSAARSYSEALRRRGLEASDPEPCLSVALFGGLFCGASGAGETASGAGQRACCPAAYGVFEKPSQKRVAVATPLPPTHAACDVRLGGGGGSGAGAGRRTKLCTRLHDAQVAAAAAEKRSVDSRTRVAAQYEADGDGCVSVALKLLEQVFAAALSLRKSHGLAGEAVGYGVLGEALGYLVAVHQHAGGAGAACTSRGEAASPSEAMHRHFQQQFLVLFQACGKHATMWQKLEKGLQTLTRLRSQVWQVGAAAVDGTAASAEVSSAVGAEEIDDANIDVLSNCCDASNTPPPSPLSDSGAGTPRELHNEPSAGTVTLRQARQGLLLMVQGSVAQRLCVTTSESRKERVTAACHEENRRPKIPLRRLQDTIRRLEAMGRAKVQRSRGVSESTKGDTAAAVCGEDSLTAFEKQLVRQMYYLPLSATRRCRNLLQMCYETYARGGEHTGFSRTRVGDMLSAANVAASARDGFVGSYVPPMRYHVPLRLGQEPVSCLGALVVLKDAEPSPLPPSSLASYPEQAPTTG